MQKTASIELGRYQLLERIGEGGSGQVYRARGPDGLVAIKLLGPASDLDDAARARFRRELDALAALSHPNLISLVEHDIDPELGPYLVLPLLAGTNLRAVIAGRAVCPEAALLMLQPIAEATAALHAAGYVHRDLKPENVIAGPDGTVTVIDLGLAWREGMTRHTDTGAAVGSIGYMAPEQVEGRAVDAAVDVWALGVMLYEWIAGRRPFARPRPAEEAAAVLVGACARLTAADRRASEPLAEFVARCLSLDPAKRPSARDVVAAIAEHLDWTDTPAAERAAAIADPTAYQDRVAPFRVRRLARAAREAIEYGEAFAALALCDRGLAYAPEHTELLELVAAAERTASQPTPAATPTVAASSSTADVARAVAATSPAGDSRAVAAPPLSVVDDARHATRTRRWPWIAGGVAVLGLAIGVGLGARQFADDKRDPWAASSSPPMTAPAHSTTASSVTDEDRELARTFLSLFGQALAARPDSSASAPSSTPTTARGWLDLAATQEPAQAAISARHALQLNPEWSDAQIVLCAALTGARDPGAVGACDAALRKQPGEAKLYGARGAAYLNAGKYAEAIADLTRAIAGDPSPTWRRLRAKAKDAAGDTAGAARDRQAACELGDAEACTPAR